MRDNTWNPIPVIDQDAELRRATVEGRLISGNWPEARKLSANYGEFYDYECYDRDDGFVIRPLCEAALQWCWHYLPDCLPHTADGGYLIEYEMPSKHWILRKMYDDGLRSDEDRAAEDHNQALQGEMS